MSKGGKNKGFDDDAEWDRVLQNPDNMIVSDSLRDSVASILSSRSEDTGFYVNFVIDDHRLTLELTRFDRSRQKTVISGMCDRAYVRPVLASDVISWSKAQITCGDEILFEVSLRDLHIDVSYEFSSTAGVCFITLTCLVDEPESKKHVL